MPPTSVKQTLFETSSIEIRTPNDGLSPAYIYDVAWYINHRSPRRRHSIRQYIPYNRCASYPDEPLLWEYVVEIDPGVFTVVPIWRGSAYFATSRFDNYLFASAQSDNAVIHLLIECGKRGGIEVVTRQVWSKGVV